MGVYAAPGDVDEEPSQESTSLGAEPAMSLSLTSSFASQSQISSKRDRDSPPSNSRPRKKHDSGKERARRSTPPRAASSSAQGSTSPSRQRSPRVHDLASRLSCLLTRANKCIVSCVFSLFTKVLRLALPAL
jgi:hypothetical protein